MNTSEQDWVVVKAFSTPIEAHVARSLLENEDLECFLKDEHTVTANWLYSNAIGGVKLCVRPADQDRAKELLREADSRHDPEANRCPVCGGSEVERDSPSRRVAFFLFFFLHLPTPFRRRGLRCGSCGNRWSPAEDVK